MNASQQTRSPARIPVVPYSSKVCPVCGHTFQGKGWEGIDAHWRAKHEDIMPYGEAWPLLREGAYQKEAQKMSGTSHAITQDEVIKALRETANRPWTAELAFQQKVSGIMGGLPFDSTITREQIEDYVRKQEGMMG